jgi:hypothetical protein
MAKSRKNKKNGREIVLEKATNREWGLCIFFSVDLEGATAYKVETRSKKGDEDWCAVFEKFYKDFPEQLLGEYMPFSQSKATSGIDDPIKPCLWKFVGDEILFYAPLTDSRQTLEHVRAFGQAIVLYNKRLQGEHKSVRCKGTAWIGGFPIINRIVITPDFSNKSNLCVDFVGSSIDCGFRLAKFSSPRRLVVSMDLLWMFAESFLKCTPDKRYEGIKFRYHGEYELKGVFSGKRYPVFWYDLYRDGESIEDQWIHLPPPCNCESLISYCQKIVKRINENDFIRPFITDDPSGLFGTRPDSFDAQRQALPIYEEKRQRESPKSNTKQGQAKQDTLPSEALPLPTTNDDPF